MTTVESAGLPAAFAARVEAAPASLAVVCDGSSLTYDALNRFANRIAHAILAAGAGRTAPAIGVLVDHGAEAIAGMLGAFKAGGVYVPLDPSYPLARTAQVVADVEPAVLVTSAAHAGLAADVSAGRCPVVLIGDLESGDDRDPAVSIDPDALAYVLYTSGSSGRPKGVMQTHRNAAHYAETLGRQIALAPGDRVSLLFSFSFGASILNTLGTLLAGATSCPYDVKRRGTAALARWIREHGITIYHSVPTLLRHLTQDLADGDVLATVRAVILAGEPLYPRDLAACRRHFRPATAVVNQLGCTEASIMAIGSLSFDAAIEGAYVPVGFPAEGMRISVVNDQGAPLAAGATGELVVTSRYLSPGYWRQADLTAAAFSAAPDGSGERLYRTNDLAQWLADGRLVHLGRKDSRIKLRGMTIEAAEIEGALLADPSVREAAVVARETRPDVTQLVAFVVAATTPPPSAAALRRAVSGRVPDYMVPTRIVFLDELPLTPSGKVDRAALPAAALERPAHAAYVPPRRLLDMQLAKIWEEVLDIRPIGITDDFFELGGHSLLAARMIALIEERLGWTIAPASLLTASTIQTLVPFLLEGRDPSILMCAQQGSPDRLPLFFLHGDLQLGGYYWRELIRGFDADQPVYILQPFEPTGTETIEGLAERYLELIRRVRPAGPYLLGGYCHGGTIAFEIAQQLRKAGESVPLLVLVEINGRNCALAPIFPAIRVLERMGIVRRATFMTRVLTAMARTRGFKKRFSASGGVGERARFLAAWIARATARAQRRRADLGGASPAAAVEPAGRDRVVPATPAWVRRYSLYGRFIPGFMPAKYAGPLVLVYARDGHFYRADSFSTTWGRIAPNALVHVLPGSHKTVLIQPELGPLLQKLVRSAQEAGSGRLE